MDLKGIGKGALIAALGTAGGTAIIAAASWAFGFHHQVWLWIAGAVGSIRDAFMYPVTVPAGLIAAGVLYALMVVRFWWLAEGRASEGGLPNAQDTPATASPDVAPEPPPLTDNETAIVRLLARADGACMTVFELAPRAALSNLVTEQTIDRLSARGFMKQVVNVTRDGHIASALPVVTTRLPRGT